MATYDKGDLVRCSAAFSLSGGGAVDPTEVYFTYKTPQGATTVLHYGVDGALIRDSAGNYHVDLDASLEGSWRYRWHSTGTGQAAGEGSFLIRQSEV